MLIHVILTGGTIDSYYDGSKDTAIPQEHSVIPRFVKGLNLPHKFKFTEVCMKDSRAMNQTDLKNVLNTIKRSTAQKIIVTHGTYTMADTARFIAHHLPSSKKTIILTGSMIPLDGFNFSDAGFNLGFALAEVLHQSAGVYVAMNGQLISSERATKIISEGRFTTL